MKIAKIFASLFTVLFTAAHAQTLCGGVTTNWYTNEQSASSYTLTSCSDLYGLAQLVNNNTTNFSGKTIYLGANIEMSGTWTPIGNATRSFAGTFDGQGHIISGLDMSSYSYNNYVGFFGNASGTIKNVHIKTNTIKTYSAGDNAMNEVHIGGLVGRYSGSRIENSGVSAHVEVDYKSGNIHGNGYVGGLVGYANNAFTIENCYSVGTVKGRTAHGNIYAGGLVGYAAYGKVTIINSYSQATVWAEYDQYDGAYDGYENSVGGLIGSNKTGGQVTITNSYANPITYPYLLATGTGINRIGGIIGINKGTLSGTSTYFNSLKTSYPAGSSTSTVSGITAKEGAALKNQSTYANWDFTTIWGLEANGNSPYLMQLSTLAQLGYHTLNESNTTISNISSQSYTGAAITPAVTVTYGGATLAAANYNILYMNNTNAGTARVEVTGKGGTYRGTVGKDFTITPKTLTFTGAAAQDKTYDGTTEAAITGELSGMLGGDEVSYEGIGAFADKNVGSNKTVTAAIALTGDKAGNYVITQPTGLTASIGKKDLAITLSPKTVQMKFSDDMPNIAEQLSFEGLAAGDAEADIAENIEIEFTSSYIEGVPGSYPIALSESPVLTNYNTTFDNTGLLLEVTGDISECAVSGVPEQEEYTSLQITPPVSVACGGKPFLNANYTVDYGTNKNAGEQGGTITIKGISPYTDSIAKTFAINKKALAVIGAQVTEKIYDGTTEAAITNVSLQGVLDSDTSNVLASNLTGTFATANAGTNIEVSANILLSGTAAENYSITQPELTGTITPKFLAEDAIQTIASQEYTGLAITPNIAVIDNSTTLTDADYDINWENNTNAGTNTASVTVEGKGNYQGIAMTTFTISPKNLSADAIQAIASQQTYTGSAITPSITVMDGSKNLNKDTDYELSVSSNRNVGTAFVRVAGIGNYAGALDTTFEILPKELSNSMLGAISNQLYTGEEIIPDIIVNDGDRILIEGTDYDVSYSNNTSIGFASASITGKGNYTGEAGTSFMIVESAGIYIEDLEISDIPDQLYTGAAITPLVTIKDGSKTLEKDIDYTIDRYINNTGVGTAVIQISGIGSYSGTKNVSFKIVGNNTPILSQIAASQIRAQSAANAIMLQNLPQNAKIEAYTMQGKRIYSSTSHSPLATSLSIPVSAGGIYIVKVSLGSQKQILKVPVR